MIARMATYEALAPLGRLESLSDILAAGADAVYAGLYGFSSRPSDADLSLEQLESARELTAKRGVKLYVAVNSFIGHTQMDALLRQLEIVEQLGADAVILGDWGVLQAARSALKTTRLHASTLLGVYNSETVSILKGLGVDRIVLSTALYIEEIHSLLRQTPDIEYEIIASGGICRNDNRQCELPHDGKSLDYKVACRRTYFLQGDGPRRPAKSIAQPQLQLERILGAYMAMGIQSYKIEGRTLPRQTICERVRRLRKAIDSFMEDSSHFSGYNPYFCQASRR